MLQNWAILYGLCFWLQKKSPSAIFILLAYFLAECSSLPSFPNGQLYFCHLSPVQVVIPPQKFQPQQDTRRTETETSTLYSGFLTLVSKAAKPKSVTLNSTLFCLQHGAFLPLWNPLPPANSEFHSTTLNSNLFTLLYFFWLQMQTVRSVLVHVISNPRWWRNAQEEVDIVMPHNPGCCNSNGLQSNVLKIIYNL